MLTYQRIPGSAASICLTVHAPCRALVTFIPTPTAANKSAGMVASIIHHCRDCIFRQPEDGRYALVNELLNGLVNGGRIRSNYRCAIDNSCGNIHAVIAIPDAKPCSAATAAARAIYPIQLRRRIAARGADIGAALRCRAVGDGEALLSQMPLTITSAVPANARGVGGPIWTVAETDSAGIIPHKPVVDLARADGRRRFGCICRGDAQFSRTSSSPCWCRRRAASGCRHTAYNRSWSSPPASSSSPA